MQKPLLFTAQERGLAFTVAALSFAALIGHFAFPLTPQRVQALLAGLGMHAHVGAHVFADGRSWLGIGNAMDVLSNLPFAAFGAWGLLRLKTATTNRVQKSLFQLFFSGLLLITVGSMVYHLSPSDDTLLWDRLGMTVAFAGVLGFAASERVSERAGTALAAATLLGALVALWVWHTSGDVLAWSVVQFGGMALVLALATMPRQAHAIGISLLAIIAFYAVAKVLESADHRVYGLTQQWVCGHSLKHLVASLAALPILSALKNSCH